MNNYIERKQRGLVQIQRNGASLAFLVKQFSSETGDELSPEAIGVSLARLEREEAVLVARLADVRAMIADVRAAESAPAT